MKQVLQNLKSGKTLAADVPIPGIGPNSVLIQTKASLVSAGTERMLVEFGRSSLVSKAKSQPEKVRQVLAKMKTDGLLQTVSTVLNRLDEPLPLGYCNAGVVLRTGSAVAGLKAGDRVASNGPHAEFVAVGRNLCARIPDEVRDQDAAFVVLSSVGLQGIRLLQPELGEKVVVYGLGLIGLLCIQMLKANGCDVLGVDTNESRCALAEGFGASTVNPSRGLDSSEAALSWTSSRGVDGVLITAAARTDEIIHHSARMCRKRGRIVLVGTVGLNINRSDFYEKELTLQVSCSYGPGRYDEQYEMGGVDYPFGFVRWTEQRNFEAVLELMRTRKLVVEPLISHRFPIERAHEAYDLITGSSSALGVILTYPAEPAPSQMVFAASSQITPHAGRPRVAVIGAGNFAKMTLLPTLAKSRATISHIVDLNTAAAQHLASKYQAQEATSDYTKVLHDEAVPGVIIATGHNTHAQLTCEAMRARKHVLVEKPLAMNVAEIQDIVQTAQAHPEVTVSVGFNRRFSPHVVAVKNALAGRLEPIAVNVTVNAGAIPRDHWVHDPVRGGGRIIGEACHFIDLVVFLASSLVKSVAATRMSGTVSTDDRMSISIGLEDGSIGTVNYFANGSKRYPKETIEVFSEGRVARVDNFRKTSLFGFRKSGTVRTVRQNKGHQTQFDTFVERLEKGGGPLIPLDQLLNVTLASFAAITSATEQRMIQLRTEYANLLSRTETANPAKS